MGFKLSRLKSRISPVSCSKFYLVSLKDRLKRLAASQPLFEQLMFQSYRLRNGAKVAQEIERRKNLSIFDYHALSEEIAYGPEERVIDNNLYGYASYLKDYAGIKSDLKSYMEHGLFLGGIVHPDQYHWHFRRIITMSEARREILKDKIPQKESIAVGPYIHYAQALLNETKMQALKRELGKTLLVYPFHSAKHIKTSYDEDGFISEIKRVARDFDSVLVCLYYLDTKDPDKVAAYESEGFKIVTNGHRFDRHFVARQRTHIELADLTMSNTMGTHTGFCVYLNKPHYIYKQEIKQQAASLKDLKRMKVAGAAGNAKKAVAAERDFFISLYRELSMEISEKQWEATADFWGFKDIKTATELNSFLR